MSAKAAFPSVSLPFCKILNLFFQVRRLFLRIKYRSTQYIPYTVVIYIACSMSTHYTLGRSSGGGPYICKLT